jgi:hypothetical protein
MHPFHILLHYFSMIHFNIIPSYLYFSYSVTSLPILRVLVYMNFLFCDESYMSQRSHSLDLGYFNKLWRILKVTKLFNQQYSPSVGYLIHDNQTPHRKWVSRAKYSFKTMFEWIYIITATTRLTCRLLQSPTYRSYGVRLSSP